MAGILCRDFSEEATQVCSVSFIKKCSANFPLQHGRSKLLKKKLTTYLGASRACGLGEKRPMRFVAGWKFRVICILFTFLFHTVGKFFSHTKIKSSEKSEQKSYFHFPSQLWIMKSLKWCARGKSQIRNIKTDEKTRKKAMQDETQPTDTGVGNYLL